MKIVHLLGWYFPDSVGGTEVYVSALCRRLREAGHTVRVAAPTVRQESSGTYQYDGVPVFRYAIPDTPTRDEALHRVPVRGAAALYEWLQEERPDVLHLHSITTGAGLPEIREARRQGIRAIATCHLPGLGFMCRSGELMQWGAAPCDGIVEIEKCASCNLVRRGMPRSVARMFASTPLAVSRMFFPIPGRLGTTLGMSASVLEYESMQHELFTMVESFVVLNDTARRMLTANGSPASKVVVNRLGVCQHDAARKPDPRQKPTVAPIRFGYVGRLHPSKGLTELVDAVCRIPDAAITLEIRGPVLDESTKVFVDSLQSKSAGDARIRFAPAVAADEMPQILRKLDVLVCPSVLFENGPTVALEAHAVGTPVIGSRVGNLVEIIEDGVTGRLLNPGDVQAWATALRDIASAPATTVDEWRTHLRPPRTMDDVARDYLALYAM